jgi:hypothetical protein
MEEIGIRKLGVKNELFQVGNSGGVDEQMRGEDGYILVVKGAIVIIRAVGEVVGFVGRARLVDEFKIEFSHFW